MTKNNLLNLAIIVCKFLRVVYIGIFLILTGFFIHLQVDRQYYENTSVIINNSEVSFVSVNSINLDENNSEILTLDKIVNSSLYVNYLKFAFILFLLFFSVKEFQKIMQSVKSLNTFRNDNVKSFRRIGKYMFIYFLLSSFFSYNFEHIGYSGFQLSITPLIIVFFAFIMAEIFKEGNQLLEDKELTI